MNRTRARLAPAGAAFLLTTGCVAYEAEPLAPTEELALLLRRDGSDIDGPPDRAVPTAAAWFPLTDAVRLADGLTLAEAETLALFFGPSLVQARARHRVAGAQLLQAGLLDNPELFVGPRLSAEDAALVLPASLMFAIPLGDRLAAEEERAGAEHAAAAWRVAEAELELLLSVRLAFLRLRQLAAEVRVWTTMLDDAERIASWAGRLAQAGEVDPITGYLARLERDDAVAELRRAELAFAETRAELQAMVGLLPQTDIEPVLDESVTALPPTPLAADDESMLHHPRLLAAEADYRRAEADLRHEVELQYPDLGIGPDVEFEDNELTLGIGLALSIPLFDRNQGAIAAAAERRRLARDEYRAALIALRHEADRARRHRESALALQAATAESMATAEVMEAGLRARLEAGQASLLEVLAARRAIGRARVRAAELSHEAIAAALRQAVADGRAAWNEEDNDNDTETGR